MLDDGPGEPPLVPRKSNSLKDLRRMLSAAATASEGKKTRNRPRVEGSRRAVKEAQEAGLKVHGAKLNDTEANASNDVLTIETINKSLARYGVQFIANERAVHVYESWPGMDRRQVSGSVWDGREPQSDAPWRTPKLRFPHECSAGSGQSPLRAPLMEERPASGGGFKTCSPVRPWGHGGCVAR